MGQNALYLQVKIVTLFNRNGSPGLLNLLVYLSRVLFRSI